MQKNKVLEKVISQNRRINYLSSLNNNLLYWDTISSMPPKGIDSRIGLISFLSEELFLASRQEEFLENIARLEALPSKSKELTAMIRKVRDDLKISQLIPRQEYLDYKALLAQAEAKWKEAREANDFKILQPYFERVIEYLRDFAAYAGYEDYPYEGILKFNLIDTDYGRIKEIIGRVKDFSLDLLEEIRAGGRDLDQPIFQEDFSREGEKTMTGDLLSRLGFDFQAGRLDQGHYPTVLPVNSQDVRILAPFDGPDLRASITRALHLGSQAIYQQGISPDLEDYGLANPASMISQEAVASFYKNYLGKTRSFWKFYYPLVQDLFPAFKALKLEDFYRALNRVKPGPLRLEADELTYNLHTIIRFELEEELINGELEVKDLPGAWNKKYRDYLGLTPPNDLVGVLQDVHWVSGYFGYVSNYLLANVFASQLRNTILEEMPDLEAEVEAGNWEYVKGWFETKIFTHGARYSTEELIYVVTDESLNEKYFLNYLNEKYRDIYDL